SREMCIINNIVFTNNFLQIVGILGVVYGALILKTIGTIEVNGQVGFPPQAILPIGLITLGSIVVFISFLGCCGAIRESVCMTMTYAVFLLVLLILQLTLIVLLFTHKDSYENAMGKVIDNAWENRDKGEGGVYNGMERALKCCGRIGAPDYLANFQTLPDSCCEGSCLNPANIYGGCRNKFISVMSGDSEKAKYFGLGLIAVELVGFIFACCLANNVRNYKRRNGV
ncbi:hypothetical protein KR044_004938, partial [Drosophila immigrans]